MAQTQLKYRINEKLDDLNHQQYKQALKDLREQLGIDNSQLYRIRNYKVGESNCATTDQLLTIALYFNCSVDDLLTREPAMQ